MRGNAIAWHRRVYERLRSWGGLFVGLVIGAVAFGMSTAGAGSSDDLQDPAGPQRIDEECAEGCSQEEVREWIWNGEPFLEDVLWSPPPTTTTPVRLVSR